RAKENLKGRMALSMESTSNRMSRLGKSLITDTELMTIDRIIAEIDAVDAGEVAELAAVLLAPEALSASGIGLNQDRFLAPVEEAHQEIEIDLGDPVALDDCKTAVDFTQPDAVERDVSACVQAGVPLVVETTGFDRDAVDRLAREHGVPVFHAPNFAVGAVLM